MSRPLMLPAILIAASIAAAPGRASAQSPCVLPGTPDSAGTLDCTFGSAGSTLLSVGYIGAPYGHTLATQSDGKVVVAVAAYVDAAQTTQAYYVVRYLPSGAVDTSFDGDGVAEIRLPTPGNNVRTVTIQMVEGEERIVVAGVIALPGKNNPGWAVARLRANGALDTSFNGTGILTFGMEGNVWDSGVDAAGRVVIVGGTAANFVAVRLNTSGSFDTTFGSAGKATVVVGAAASIPEAGARALAFQTVNGQQCLVLGGKSTATLPTKRNKIAYWDMTVIRLLPTGTVDSSFGVGGTVIIAIANQQEAITAVAVDADNSLVAAGWAVPGSAQFTLARFSASGQLQWRVETPIQSLAVPYSVLVQADGRIVLSGRSTNNYAPETTRVTSARYLANGSLDPTYGSAGVSLVNVAVGDDWGYGGAVLQSNGRIVISGVNSVGAYTTFLVGLLP